MAAVFLRFDCLNFSVKAWARAPPPLATLLREGEMLIHPGVIGEPVCGNLRNRSALPAMRKCCC